MRNEGVREKRFLLILTLMVFTLTVTTVLSILREPMAKTFQSGIVFSSSRTPAAANMATSNASVVAAEAQFARTITLELNCKNFPAKEVQGTHLRIRANQCGFDLQKSVTVINQSNGFEGSVVFAKDNSFSTDFMDLRAGANRFEIQGMDAQGMKVTHSFVVNNRIPASAGN